MKQADFVIMFQIHQPLKGKEYEEVGVKKLVFDAFPQPFRGEKADNIIDIDMNQQIIAPQV